MKTLPKLISAFALLFACLSNTRCQVPGNQKSTSTDTSAAYRLQASRQQFWDHPPKPVGPTNDFEGLFTPDQKQYFNLTIGEFEKKTSIEIAIVTIDTLHVAKENFEALALHIHNTWGVGKKGINNGIVICISAGYKSIRISNGDGIRKMLSDSATKDIIDQDFIPGFKQGDYYKGTHTGLDSLMAKLEVAMKH